MPTIAPYFNCHLSKMAFRADKAIHWLDLAAAGSLHYLLAIGIFIVGRLFKDDVHD